MGWVEAFGHFKKDKRWALVIGAINLVGIVYGFYYYTPQFARTPWWLWIFVPDSPLAVLWAELALAAFWLGRPQRWLDALAFVGNVQVGLWTVYVLLAFAGDFHTLDFLNGGGVDLNAVLLVGHAGMALLALIFVEGLRDATRATRNVAAGVALAYYLANDIVDYFGNAWGLDFLGHGCGMRPYTVPCRAASEPALTAVTFALTLAAAGALVLAINVGRDTISSPRTT